MADHFEAGRVSPLVARKTWRTLEPLHGIVYFAPEAAARYEALGAEGAMGYFASRSAPMGPVLAGVVIATFFNFEPSLVRSAIPAAWEVATPAQFLEARLSAADQALRRLLHESVLSDELRRAARLARRAAEQAAEHLQGRPLFAAHALLPWPADEEAHLVLWHAQSLLREYRGDGHVAVLVESGIDPVEALVVHAATGEVPASVLQATRGWSVDAWDAGVESVQARGWLDGGGALTAAGRDARQRVEEVTDRMATVPYSALGEVGCEELRRLARPFSRVVVDEGPPLPARGDGVTPLGGSRAPTRRRSRPG